MPDTPCRMCGAAESEPVAHTRLCASCLDSYRAYDCPGCGMPLVVKAEDDIGVCKRCRLRPMLDKMHPEERETLDRLILEGEIKPGLKLLVKRFGIRAGEALTIFTFRYDALREAQPEGFEKDDGEYWKGFP